MSRRWIPPGRVRDPDPDGRGAQHLGRVTYYCRACDRREPASNLRVPPVGWLMLTAIRTANPVNHRDRYARLGIYCSADCLAGAIPHISRHVPAAGPSTAAPTEGTTNDG